MKTLLLIIVLGLSFSSFAGGVLGKVAPDFSDLNWKNSNDKPTKIPSIKEHRGKVVILKFWQSWCPGCLREGLPTLYKLQEHFKKNEQVVIYSVQTVFEGFGVNNESKLASIRKRFKLTMPMAHDDGKIKGIKHSVMLSRYKAGGTPWFVIIAPGGKVVLNGFRLDYEKTLMLIKKLLHKKISSKPI